MTATATAARPSLFMRAIHATPILGRIAREIAEDVNTVFYALVIVVTLVVLAVKLWGIAALAMAALAMVPVMFVIMLLISRG